MEEEVQAGRGVGVDEACVHPPHYLATKFFQGFPPYFPILNIILARCSLRWDANRLPDPPTPPCARRRVWGGLGLSEP